MRYKPSCLDWGLSERLTWDFSRALCEAHHPDRPVSFQRQFVQLSYLYDVLRSLSEAGWLGFAHPAEIPVIEELMMRVQDLQVELRKGPAHQ
ncbi:MAG TPA: hypothetical protein H9755_02640 [Candidatus Dietzia intestinigallinarum]|nr:hypothetical protein [Candidatus Dietzia intestinigallinarum]